VADMFKDFRTSGNYSPYWEDERVWDDLVANYRQADPTTRQQMMKAIDGYLAPDGEIRATKETADLLLRKRQLAAIDARLWRQGK
jgi:hypothetical protein